MKIIKNTILEGKHNKPILVDVFYPENQQQKPVVIFCHGYKGFKDWGAWNVMAKAFAEAGFFFVKFNFSHNGGTVKQPIDFPDLEAFGNNNFTKELDDLETVIDWVSLNSTFKTEIDLDTISLIGHSRGGGIVAIKAAEDSRIKQLITLAGVSDFASRFPTNEVLKQWKQEGVMHIINGRTHQKMPHFYRFYENFKQYETRFNIQRAISRLNIPYLIIHGNQDPTVPLEEAKNLHSWNTKSKLEIIENTNHVFNTSHPWEKENLSEELKKVTQLCIDFLS